MPLSYVYYTQIIIQVLTEATLKFDQIPFDF